MWVLEELSLFLEEELSWNHQDTRVLLYPHISVGGKSSSLCTYMPDSTKVYHPFAHMDHQIYLRNDYNNIYMVLFDYIFPSRGLLFLSLFPFKVELYVMEWEFLKLTLLF